MQNQHKHFPHIVWLGLGLIWGTTWLFIKIGLSDLPPFTFAALRFGLAAIPLLIINAVRRPQLPRTRSTWLLMVVTGLMTISLNYGLVFWGAGFISSGQTATLHATLPFFAILIAHIHIRKERLNRRKLFGVILGCAGIAMIFSKEIGFGDCGSLAGSAAIVLAAAGTAYSIVLVKKHLSSLDSVLLTTVQMLAGMIPLFAIGLATGESLSAIIWTPISLVCLGYLSLVGSSLAFVMLFWLVRRMDVATTQLTPFVSTLTAVIAGLVVLGEPMTWRFLLGAAGVLIGLLVSLGARAPRASSRQ